MRWERRYRSGWKSGGLEAGTDARGTARSAGPRQNRDGEHTHQVAQGPPPEAVVDQPASHPALRADCFKATYWSYRVRIDTEDRVSQISYAGLVEGHGL